jgi:hypothetical protein
MLIDDYVNKIRLYYYKLYLGHQSRHCGLNSINQLVFVMVKCGILFEVRALFLNVI